MQVKGTKREKATKLTGAGAGSLARLVRQFYRRDLTLYRAWPLSCNSISQRDLSVIQVTKAEFPLDSIVAPSSANRVT
jgi:hypothetical protein